METGCLGHRVAWKWGKTRSGGGRRRWGEGVWAGQRITKDREKEEETLKHEGGESVWSYSGKNTVNIFTSIHFHARCEWTLLYYRYISQQPCSHSLPAELVHFSGDTDSIRNSFLSLCLLRYAASLDCYLLRTHVGPPPFSDLLHVSL